MSERREGWQTRSRPTGALSDFAVLPAACLSTNRLAFQSPYSYALSVESQRRFYFTYSCTALGSSRSVEQQQRIVSRPRFRMRGISSTSRSARHRPFAPLLYYSKTSASHTRRGGACSRGGGGGRARLG